MGAGRRLMLGAAEQTFLTTVDKGLLIGALIAVGLAALAALAVAYYLTRPLERLTVAAQALAAGDLAHRVDVGGPGEVRGLGAAFNEMADSLEESEELRRRLVADVAHELRNPIASLRAQAEGIAEGVLPADEARLASLADDTRHLSRLVEDLQELSAAEAGAAALRDAAARPRGARLRRRPRARRCARAGRRRAALRRATARCTVEGDEGRLSQVMRNLLDNALRHTASGSVTRRVRRARPATRSSRSATPARASPPPTCPTSSSASTAPTPPGPATPAAAASGSPSRGASSRTTAAPCSRATARAAALSSASAFRLATSRGDGAHAPARRAMRTIVGVMGSGEDGDAALLALGPRTGRGDRREGWVLLNGGRDRGVMDASAEGASLAGGLVVGVLPDEDTRGASRHLDVAIRTGHGRRAQRRQRPVLGRRDRAGGRRRHAVRDRARAQGGARRDRARLRPRRGLRRATARPGSCASPRPSTRRSS